MCGIVGIISDSNFSGFTLKEETMFKQLLYIDALRGEDATGIFVVGKDGDVELVKDNVDSHTMETTGGLTDILKYAFKEGRCAIGHNRKKTLGANVDANAHPFAVKDEFVFVHNGTLYSHKKLADTEVDSEALAQHIHKAFDNGYDKVVFDEAMDKVNGAFACVWFDQRNQHLYMMRNKERPLFIAKLKKGGWMFASELAMIYLVCNRNGELVEEAYMLEEDHLYSFDMSGYSTSDISKVKIDRPAKVFTQPTKTIYQTGGHTTEETIVGDLSKNQFKNFKSKLLGTTISFLVEDYMERIPQEGNIPVSTPIDWVIFGKMIEEETFPHTIQATLSHKSMSEIIDVYDGELIGTVTGMEYDKPTRSATLYVTKTRLPHETLTPICH